MIITLDEAKLYLKVEGTYDDALIVSCIGAAEEICHSILRYPLTDFETLPETVRQAILFAVANFYEQRELLASKEMIDLMARLLFAYREDQW